MAKTQYTREQVVAFIKSLDTRAREYDDTMIDNIINRGYAELTTTSKRIFSNEEVLSLDDYYDMKELKFTVDISDDVTEIYDIYLTIEDLSNKDIAICQEVVQDIGIYRNNSTAYRDNRYIGRCHTNLAAEHLSQHVFDSLVVKYYYTPTATAENVYMDSQVYLAWQDAMWAALNYFQKDIEGEAQKRTSMQRTSKSTAQEPEDMPGFTRAIFGGI